MAVKIYIQHEVLLIIQNPHYLEKYWLDRKFSK